MKYIIVILLFVASNAAAQGRLSVHADLHYADSLKLGVGAGLMYSWSIQDKVTIGAAASALKFKNLDAFYYPIVAHMAVHPVKLGRVVPILFGEAGTGLYSYSKTYSTGEKFSAKGGFT